MCENCRDWRDRHAESCSHLSGVNLEVLVGVVSDIEKVRDNEKHCPQLELPSPWGLGRHVQTRHYYAFQFATPLRGPDLI